MSSNMYKTIMEFFSWNSTGFTNIISQFMG